MKKIIDISYYQSGANLKTAIENGIDGFIFRLGYGSDMLSQDDTSFEDFVRQAENLNKPWGAYIFSYAMSDEDLESEIQHTLRVLKGKNPKLGVYWDLEDSTYKAKNNFNDLKNKDKVMKWANTFIEKVSKEGYRTGIYCNLSYANSLNVYSIDHLWIARYPSIVNDTTKPKNCDIWQYTETENVPGVSSNVDCNYVYAEDLLKILMEASIPVTNTKYKIGDVVKYNRIYKSSDSTIALHPFIKSGKITKILEGKRNPYLINSCLGWTNDNHIE